MIASFHRLTCYWLAPNTGDASGVEAVDLLGRMRRIRVPHVTTEGHIYRYYDPEALPETPGYDWLRKRLRDLAEAQPPSPEELPFDAEPLFKAEQSLPERDPFPAFYWATLPREQGTRGILEVLAGRDTVLFHQCAIQEAKPGLGADKLNDLQETGWVFLHDSPGALFTAEFIQVSDLTSEELLHWSGELDRFENLSPFFTFHGGTIENRADYEIRLGMEQEGPAGGRHFKGMILLAQVRLESGNKNQSSVIDLHLDASGFITRFCTLLINSQKVECQHRVAQTKFTKLEEALRGYLADFDRTEKQRSRVLALPLSRSEVEVLQRVHRSAREGLEEADQLVDTCLRNVNQFEDFSEQLLRSPYLWAQNYLLRLRRLNDQLQAWRRSLDSQARWLQAEIELLLATGGRFAGDYTRELVRFVAAHGRRKEGFPPLVTADHPLQQDVEIPRTVWLTGIDGEEILLVLRPGDVPVDRRKDLTALYFTALCDCSSDRIRVLMGRLCNPGGRLRLAGADPEPFRFVPIGNLFQSTDRTKTPDPGSWQLAESFLAFHPFSDAYAGTAILSLMQEVDKQDRVGILSLIAFLEAVTRFLASPPPHLDSVAREYSVERSRLLFLVGFLHVVSRESDEAKGYLWQATQSALDNQDFAWAYSVAKFFQEYERRFGTESSLPEQAVSKRTSRGRQIWKEQLAQEFLKVYDLDSAVSLAQSSLPAREGRPWRMRGVLWGVAFVVGGSLLLADKLVGPSSPHWFAAIQNQWGGFVLVSASALAALGAPLALWLGARRAMEQLFPAILFPRILGAITLGAIALCASEETEKLVTAKAPIFTMMVVVSLAGGIGYLYSEVRKKVSSGAECLRRCFDVFCLAFLEAACLSTAFVLIYEGMFEAAYDKAGYYTVRGVFLRPHNIFLIAILSMFIGIVVQVMTQFSEKRAEASLSEMKYL